MAALAVVAILAAGCGDSSDGGSSASNSPPSGNTGGTTGGTGSTGGTPGIALSISVTPPPQVLQDTQFAVTPTVAGANGVAVTFAAQNLPSWASINPVTGRVAGTPGAGHVGVYSNIRLTVSGGGQTATSPPFTVTVVPAARGTATLSWFAPTTRTDGSPLGADLAGYKIYYGESPGSMNRTVTIQTPGILTYVVDDLTPATWYFATTAYDRNGLESALSNVASKTIN